MPVGERIRVKFSTGVYECTLLQVNPSDETVQVAWSEGGTKIFSWNKIILGGWKAGPVQRNALSTALVAGPANSGKASSRSLVLTRSSKLIIVLYSIGCSVTRSSFCTQATRIRRLACNSADEFSWSNHACESTTLNNNKCYPVKRHSH